MIIPNGQQFDRLTEEEDVIKAAEIIAKEVATIRRFM